MRILALDSSGKTAGVCIAENGNIVSSHMVNQGLTHSQTLLALVQRALEEGGFTPAMIDCYGVTAGPGSFTGLRIGLALVKGLALPGGTPVAPVSTLRAIALGCGLPGTVVPALDARRGEVYWAAFECADGGCTQTLPDCAGPATEIEDKLNLAVNPLNFVGDGAQLCYNTYNYVQRPLDMAQNLLPNIARGTMLATQEALATGAVISADLLHPEYLRLSQAERERAENQG